MNIEELIGAAETRLSAAVAARQTARDALLAIQSRIEAGDTSATGEADGAIAALRSADLDVDTRESAVADLREIQRRDEATARIASETVAVPRQRAAHDQAVRTGTEPHAYSRSTARDVSFFADAYAVSAGIAGRDARERIERNEREVRAFGDVEQRATTTSSYAGLVVPQYLVDLAANVLRAGRPTANACMRMPIPDQGMTFLLPRATTGVTEASQATENSSVSSTDQVWANTTVPVATIAGQQDVSRQSLERGTPGIDQLIYADLAAAYSAELDRQIFVGTGASGQMTSINGQSGINTATLYGAAVTVATFYSKLAGQIAAVAGAGTAVRPSLIVMHPRRWGWLTASLDSSNRPIVTPNANGPYNAYGLNLDPGAYGLNGAPDATTGYDIVGQLHGLPVITDSNVPTNLGGGSTEDVVFVFDQRHALLFEDGGGLPRQLRFEQTLGNQLTVKLVAYGYAAFTAGRYPAAFGRVGGADATGANGHQAPTF